MIITGKQAITTGIGNNGSHCFHDAKINTTVETYLFILNAIVTDDDNNNNSDNKTQFIFLSEQQLSHMKERVLMERKKTFKYRWWIYNITTEDFCFRSLCIFIDLTQSDNE